MRSRCNEERHICKVVTQCFGCWVKWEGIKLAESDVVSCTCSVMFLCGSLCYIFKLLE
jgi:hypothetical protein